MTETDRKKWQKLLRNIEKAYRLQYVFEINDNLLV